jgi:hypothetical protein
LLLASLVADARLLQWQVLPEAAYGRARDRSNSRLVGAVRSGTLWLLTGSLSNDAELAGRRANLRFRYLSCPPDRDWVRRFAQIRETSPWLLLNVNVNPLNTGPAYYSRLGPPCPAMLVGDLQRALTAAGWHLAFEENGYQVWSGEPARRPEEPKEGGARAHPRPDAELSRDG